MASTRKVRALVVGNMVRLVGSTGEFYTIVGIRRAATTALYLKGVDKPLTVGNDASVEVP